MDDRTFAPGTPSRQDSPQFRDGKFRNSAPMRKHSLGETARIWWTFMFNKPAGTVPRQDIPVRPLATSALLAAPDQTLYRLGHSTMLIKLGGAFYMTDPVFSKRSSPVQWSGPARFHAPPIGIEELPPIKAVILSHDHYDHLDHAAILALDAKTTVFLAPLGVGERLVRWGISPAKVREFDWWQGTQIDGVSFVATPAQHFSGRTLSDGNTTASGRSAAGMAPSTWLCSRPGPTTNSGRTSTCSPRRPCRPASIYGRSGWCRCITAPST
jgi:hypothetical protein